MRHHLKSGGFAWLEVHATFILDEKNSIVGISGISRDITERKNNEARMVTLQQQVIQAQKMESAAIIAGGTAHNFNNVLTAILGNSELALMDLEEPDDSACGKHLRNVILAANSGTKIIRQLLIFSRGQASKPQIIDVNQTINDSLKMSRLPENIRKKFISQGTWATLIDPAQLEQALVNLFLNAKDAMPNGGSLIVSTANFTPDQAYFAKYQFVKNTEYVRISVCDSGIGIPEKDLFNVFRPFFTTKGDERGTGLGLSTVYGIVKNANGFIIVESQVGKGTRFDILLPKAAGELVTPCQQAPNPLPQGSERILLAEDDNDVRYFLRELFVRLGYHADCAKNGKEALAFAQNAHDINQPYDLLVTDVIMPRMGGLPLAAEVRKLFPHLKILFLSGYNNKMDEINTQIKDFEPDVKWVNKPITSNDLAEIIRELIDS